MRASGSTTEQLQAKALARGRREAMRLRARRIRRAVMGLAMALFASAFLIVYVQLASGHDPALVANAAKRRTTSMSVTSTEAGAAESSTSAGTTEASTGSEDSTATEDSTDGDSSAGSDDSAATESSTASGSTSGSGQPSSGASAVTTSQS
jgi:hypothetical protein